MSPIQGLYAIIDQSDPVDPTDLTPLEFARRCLEGGARLLQLRQKNSTLAEREHWARAILELKKNYTFTFIINDDPHLAKKVNADGVHVGQEDLSVEEARKILGNEKIIGKSTHSWIEAKAAMREPVDYIACGTIFPTRSKPADHPVVGLVTLEKIVRMSPVPVVAIGGINRENVHDVVATGVHSIALISALNRSRDIAAETRIFSSLL